MTRRGLLSFLPALAIPKTWLSILPRAKERISNVRWRLKTWRSPILLPISSEVEEALRADTLKTFDWNFRNVMHLPVNDVTIKYLPRGDESCGKSDSV